MEVARQLVARAVQDVEVEVAVEVAELDVERRVEAMSQCAPVVFVVSCWCVPSHHRPGLPFGDVLAGELEVRTG